MDPFRTGVNSSDATSVGRNEAASSTDRANRSTSLSSPSSSTHPDLPSTSMANPQSPPLRRIVNSASELPRKEVKAAVFSQHVATDQYVEHHRKAMEALREVHRQERAAWNIERQELHAKIAELETKMKRLQSVAVDGVTASSVEHKLRYYSMGSRPIIRSASTPGDFASAAGSRQTSISGSSGRANGEEMSDKTKSTMQSIPEEGDDGPKTVSFAAGAVPDTDINKVLEGYTIPGHLIDRDLDGIAIKATGLPAATKKAILKDSKSGTPSPMFSPTPKEEVESPSLKRPVTIEIPSTQQILQLPVKDLYTHAAGNTPLARMTDDEDGSPGAGVDMETPKMGIPVKIENEKPPLEPRPSTYDGKPVRPPTERSDSYFNVSVPAADSNNAKDERLDSRSTQALSEAGTDEDPALKGPLSMPSHPPLPQDKLGGSEFLDQLDERLTSLSRQQSRSSTTSPDHASNENNSMTDPPLRIRRSINFGSQLGHGPR